MNENTNNLTEVTNDIQFVYITIPKEYICVYHKILLMLADYGIDMLKDCKASCTERNSGVIECFNMFNAAVAAYKLNNTSLANTLIIYVKAKIEQIYKGNVDSNFVFSLDENNTIRSFISCEDTAKFFINPTDNELFANTFKDNGGIQQQFIIDTKDEEKPFTYDVSYNKVLNSNYYLFTINVTNLIDNNGESIDLNDCIITWTLNGILYNNTANVHIPIYNGIKLLNIVVYYKNKGVMTTIPVTFPIPTNID